MQTPLHSAAAVANEKAAKLLIEAGACVNSVNGALRTPLHTALHRGAWHACTLEMVVYMLPISRPLDSHRCSGHAAWAQAFVEAVGEYVDKSIVDVEGA
jgi:ankyrin repeat protein